ncbi:MAG: prenyltransferase [Dehalococcoidia bacterium]|nr:prenyltransferase [Dehalococcoidia bacterium]MDD5495077.1 prenyltransferase [Dehalococcoidia bacterium]
MIAHRALTPIQQAQAWITLLRLGPTARGILPFLLGATIAWSQGSPINIPVLLISTFAVLCVMEMTFLVNEYVDYGTDMLNTGFHRLSGGSRVLPSGLISKRATLIAALGFMLIALAAGAVLAFYYHTGIYTIPLGLLAIFIGVFYTAKPFQFSYKGWGELAIWFSCGWLATMSGYYLQTGRFDLMTSLVSLPGGASVFLVILINEVPDMVSDSIAGKRNLAVRLREKGVSILYITVWILCYLNIVINVFFGVPLYNLLLSLVLVPLIAMTIRSVVRDKLAVHTQEPLSIQTTLIDHLITIFYAVTFITAGLLAGRNTASIVALIMLFVVSFGLEALSFISLKGLKNLLK